MEKQQKTKIGKFIRKLAADYFFHKMTYIEIANLVLKEFREIFQDQRIKSEKEIRKDQERITAENTKEDCIKAIQEIPGMVDHSKCVNLQTVINAIFESKTIKD